MVCETRPAQWVKTIIRWNCSSVDTNRAVNWSFNYSNRTFITVYKPPLKSLIWPWPIKIWGDQTTPDSYAAHHIKGCYSNTFCTTICDHIKMTGQWIRQFQSEGQWSNVFGRWSKLVVHENIVKINRIRSKVKIRFWWKKLKIDLHWLWLQSRIIVHEVTPLARHHWKNPMELLWNFHVKIKIPYEWMKLHRGLAFYHKISMESIHCPQTSEFSWANLQNSPWIIHEILPMKCIS